VDAKSKGADGKWGKSGATGAEKSWHLKNKTFWSRFEVSLGQIPNTEQGWWIRLSGRYLPRESETLSSKPSTNKQKQLNFFHPWAALNSSNPGLLLHRFL
jgi:hypothetical protein